MRVFDYGFFFFFLVAGNLVSPALFQLLLRYDRRSISALFLILARFPSPFLSSFFSVRVLHQLRAAFSPRLPIPLFRNLGAARDEIFLFLPVPRSFADDVSRFRWHRCRR